MHDGAGGAVISLFYESIQSRCGSVTISVAYGPPSDGMRSFVEDKDVQQKFKETCLSRSVASLQGPKSGAVITYSQ